ncbi:uncharacterized protein [Pseudorasbora parva]|uniref:uncharacterized protein n=1 Tax=Pseudorasbora parva TaxID=51549 RepID=UPI00351F4697
MNEELNLTKYEGDDMSIQCKHHEEHQKCFCKAHEPSMCVKDGVSLETIRDDRVSFSDEASTGVFTVNITDLREEDSGIYWCGAHITTKVTLNVKKDFSMIIIIGVCVFLMLIGGFTLTVCKLRLKRRGDTHTHSFQKNEESLSDATVSFSKDQIHSDYTTVSHCMRLNKLAYNRDQQHTLHQWRSFSVINVIFSQCHVSFYREDEACVSSQYPSLEDEACVSSQYPSL